MDPTQEKDQEDISIELADENADSESVSVDDFIRELEKKEKDLHITSETTFIELASEFDEGEIPDFLQEDLAATGKTSEPDDSKELRSDIKRLEGELERLESESAKLKEKIGDLQEERTELYKNAQRRLKDFEAFKARTERERSETFQRQLSNLATQMLPALDNLDRALQFASELSNEQQNGFSQFFDGIVLVNQQVNEVLGEMGIVPIASVGEPFDPQIHEAVAIDEREDMPPNTITTELLRGFRIGDSVIRHSMVRVSALPAPASDPVNEEVAERADETDSESESEKQAADMAATADDQDELFGGEQAGGEADAPGSEVDADHPDGGSAIANDFEIERNGEVVKQSNEQGDDE
ncbi:MAG TPA: nucleotide exchange factor GrpE [Pyrinomonadaceae bacterium]|nr:nucleotide exchange factor GrpE [Pyrinomonadaceae bacterium]